MLIGPHVDPMPRHQAHAVGWTCFQTNFGNPKSSLYPGWVHAENRYDRDPFWFWHAPFVLHANTKNPINTTDYLNRMMAHGAKLNISGYVLHTGAVVGIMVKDVLKSMRSLFENLRLTSNPLVIEFGASVCNFNMDPECFVREFCLDKRSGIGYCIDLAHTNAAAVMWKDLWDLIEMCHPTVVHINYPGTDFGSSKDIHGWRTLPTIMYGGKGKVKERKDHVELCENYDNTVKLLAKLNVPMIVEGSGFSGCNVITEMETIKGIINGS